MNAGLLAQYAVIAVAVLASGAYVVRSQWPRATRRLRVACAVRLVRATPPWMQRLGRRIAPAPLENVGCGGCSSCD